MLFSAAKKRLLIVTDGGIGALRTYGEFSSQAQALAPDLDVILVDGEGLLAILSELEAFEVFVEHFDDIHLKSDIDAETGEDGQNDIGVLGRLLSSLG